MAGRGFAPKPAATRRNTSAPQRGEWVTLRPVKKSVAGKLPGGDWSERTRAAWKAWSADPATGMYGPAELQLLVDLAFIYELWVREPTAALAAELRQRQDGLGLSPKGKQDRRWQVAAVEAPSDAVAPLAMVRPLVLEKDPAKAS